MPDTQLVATHPLPAPHHRDDRLAGATVTAGPWPGRARTRDLFEGAPWTGISVLADVVALVAGALLALWVVGPAGEAGIALAAAAAATFGRLASRGLYGRLSSRVPLLDMLRFVIGAACVGAVVALAAAQVAGLEGAAAPVLLGWGLMLSTLLSGRLVLGMARRRARQSGRSGKRVLIVGAGAVAARLERRLLQRPQSGLRPVGFLDASPPAAGDVGRLGAVLGTPEDLEAVAAATEADHVVIAFSAAPDSAVQPLLRRCEELGLEVSVVPRLFEEFNDRDWVEHVGGLPLYGLHRVDPKSWQFTVKHAFDRSVAAVLVLATAPVLLLTALAVKLTSPGPVLFRQRRVGRDGKDFDILKFRSMRVAPRGTSFVPGAGRAPGGIEGDDRRTLVGAFLRRSALDELPQLLNVLKGDMSLVGPRPERPEFVELFRRDVRLYGDRHRVKSGMTGHAQVSGLRGQTSVAERAEWDNWYIRNWSLWVDFKILLLTPLAVLFAAPEDQRPAETTEAVPAGPQLLGEELTA